MVTIPPNSLVTHLSLDSEGSDQRVGDDFRTITLNEGNLAKYRLNDMRRVKKNIDLSNDMTVIGVGSVWWNCAYKFSLILS